MTKKNIEIIETGEEISQENIMKTKKVREKLGKKTTLRVKETK
jgi:hypothetical protein